MNNFKDFIKEHKVQIPLIQRDYVQGLDSNKQKRDKFLKDLLDTLKTYYKELSLDFIYGYDIEQKEKDKLFAPLDGQQRLTTLALLCFMLDCYSNVKMDDDLKESLKHFSYATRVSSNKFCEKLFSEVHYIPKDDKNKNIVKYIKNQSWYLTQWDNDPTIKAMLQMLTAIEKLFLTEEYGKDLDIMAKRMYKDNANAISFEQLDMGEFKLADSLYIKMNARGKQLTDFENWKASFISFITTQYGSNKEISDDKIRKEDREKGYTYKSYFEQSIEHEWTDMLWHQAYNSWKNDKQDKYPVIDDLFMNLYTYLLRTLFFAQTDNKDIKVEDFDKNSFEIQKEVWSKKENIEFLFQTLDFCYYIHNTDFFNSLFYIADNDNDIQENKIRLFGKKDVNLYKQCILDEDFNIKTQLLFYCILKYCIKNNTHEVTDELKQYIRYCRNWIESKQYFSKAGLDYVSDVRLTDFKDCEKEIENTPQREDTTICKIEDLSCFRGNTNNINKELLQNKDNAEKTFNAICKFLSIPEPNDDPTKKVQTLIALGYKGKLIEQWRDYDFRFFGNKDKWDVVFLSEEIKDVLPTLIEKFSSTDDANIIANNIKDEELEQIKKQENYKLTSFKYYALKYDAFLHYRNYRGNKDSLWRSFYLAINTKNNLDVLVLKYNQRPMNSLHCMAIANYIVEEFHNEKYQEIYNNLYHFSSSSEKISLHIDKFGLKLYVTEQGWQIDYKGCTIDEDDLISKIGFRISNLNRTDKTFNIRVFDNENLVTAGIDFLKISSQIKI